MTRKKKSPPPSPLSASRRRAFALILFLLPVVLLLILEVSLRFFQYGGTLDLVVKRQLGGREYYALNRRVAVRYFTGSTATIPEAMEDDRFEIVKGPKTKRIFCLGESTMAGFPYEYSATPSAFLRDRLASMLPDYNIEVVNVGLSAITSHIILDFMAELMQYEPDLFIVYVGHNEFYGAYGVGSTVAPGGSPFLTSLHLRLLKFRSYLLLRDFFLWFRDMISAPPDKRGQSLMGEMVAAQFIPYGSELYRQAREVYTRNLRAMIDLARDGDVPIVFSALVSNLRTHPPFQSVFSDNTAEEQRTELRHLLAEGDSLMRAGFLSEACDVLGRAVALDSLHAGAAFLLAQALHRLDRIEEAARMFRRARDLDALRFRASGEFEDVLRTVCLERKVPLSPVDSAFRADSPDSLPGDELILEHLHPNVRGYFLMAKTFASTIRESGLLAPPEAWAAGRALTDSAYMDLSTVAEFDHALGKVKVELLKRRWPFTTGPVNFEFTPATSIEGVVFRYLQKKIAWSEARYLLAEWYAGEKRFDLARRECRAIAKVIPFSYQPVLRLADYYRAEGKNEEAREAYRESFQAEDNPFARMKLAIILLEEEDAAGAAEQIEAAFALEGTQGMRLPTAASAAGRYLLGVAYAKLGRIVQARENLQRALAINPDDQDARQLLNQLSR